MRKHSSLSQRKPVNKFILYFSIIASIVGIIMIFEASIYRAYNQFNNGYYFAILQTVWVIMGGIIAFILAQIDYKIISKASFPIFIFNLLFLIAVLIFGSATNGSKRWFTIGIIPIQPAEFMKLSFILYLSKWLTKEKWTGKNIKEFTPKLIRFVFVLLVVLGLILIEPDLGTTMIIAITAFALFYISGETSLHKTVTIGIIAVGMLIAVIAAILEPYRIDRLSTYFPLIFKGVVVDPHGKGYQTQQILLGIGSGGLLGKGFGQSRQRYGYLPENTAFTDSISAIFLEEFGFVGGIVLLYAWLYFFKVAMNIANNVREKEMKLVSFGIGFWLTIQALLHIGTNVGLLPLTGMPLPLFTYGGSNTIVTLAGLGILLNISRYEEKK